MDRGARFRVHLEIFISCLHCGLTNLSSKRLFDSVHRLQIRLNLPPATNSWPHLRQVRLIRWGLGNSGFLIYPIAISSFLVHKPPFFGNKKPSHPFTSATRLSQNLSISSLMQLYEHPGKILANLDNSHLQVPHLGFKDPWLSVPPSRMVWPFGYSLNIKR